MSGPADCFGGNQRCFVALNGGGEVADDSFVHALAPKLVRSFQGTRGVNDALQRLHRAARTFDIEIAGGMHGRKEVA